VRKHTARNSPSMDGWWLGVGGTAKTNMTFEQLVVGI
jgi:hypothetical protein